MKVLYILLCLAALGLAQDLAPDLAPLAAQHTANQAKLDADKTAALTRLQQQYMSALEAAEKLATSTSAVASVKAIVQEREAVLAGNIVMGFPGNLPKSLQAPRKTFVENRARTYPTFAARQTQLDADYLRSLAGLNAKAAANPQLAAQINAEKKRILAGRPSVDPAAGGAKPKGGNPVVNGDFAKSGAASAPAGWENIPAAPGVSFRVTSEGTASFLRVVAKGEIGSYFADQDVEVPPGAKTMMLRGRIRAKGIELSGKSESGAHISIRFLDQQGKGEWQWVKHTSDSSWTILERTDNVPAYAKKVKVCVGAHFANGTFDFDDIEVRFQ